MKVLFLVWIWATVAYAKENSYPRELNDTPIYIRQLVHPPLAQWPNHDLGGWMIPEEGANAIARAVIENTTLKSLGFRHCDLKDSTVKPILLSMVNHPSMENLDIGFNSFHKETFKLLGKVIENNTVLKSLDISMTNCAFKNLEKLFGSVLKSSSLREFIFDFNLFHLEAVQPLLELKEPNYSLEKLSFKLTAFSSRALREFAFGARNLRGLKYLDLSTNNLTNEDAATLAQLAYNCPALEELIITNNKINILFSSAFIKEWISLDSYKKKKGLKPLTIYLTVFPRKAVDPLEFKGVINSGPRPVRIV